MERSVARLLGVDGADSLEVPLPNVLVDHVHDAGGLAAASRTGSATRCCRPTARRSRSPRRSPPASSTSRRSSRAEDGAVREHVARGVRRALKAISGRLRERRDARAPRRAARAAALRADRDRQRLRGCRARQGRRRGRRRHRRGDPLDGAEPARLRALRPDDRGLRRHVRDPGELPHHARGDGRVVGGARPLRAPVELLLGAVHVGDRRDGRARGLRQHGQRRSLRDPLPRHQRRARR